MANQILLSYLQKIEDRLNELSMKGLSNPEDFNEYLYLTNQRDQLNSEMSKKNIIENDQSSSMKMPNLGGKMPMSGMNPSGGGASIGSAWPVAVVAAAIAGQAAASKNTNTVFEGQRTNDAFSGNFGTDPWLGYLSEKMGWEPSAGEKYDAAVNNKDWDKAFKRQFSMADYWADPIRAWLTTPAREYIGSDIDALINPTGYLFRKIGG